MVQFQELKNQCAFISVWVVVKYLLTVNNIHTSLQTFGAKEP